MLEVSDLGVSFGSVMALEGVDIAVGPGEIVAISGEPGAGKTALVRCLGGDLPPSEGTIRVNGQHLGGTLRAAERQGIAVVWQEISLCETLDVAGNLLLGQETRGQMFSSKRFYEQARTLLDELGIPIENVMQRADTLSGGQRGLLALAMALIRQPRVLVLDEPTAAMGISETTEFEQQLERIRHAGVAIVLATRDVGQMFRVAQRVVVLRQGHVVAEIKPQDSHPDDVAALLAGGTVDGSARRQLTRLHGLADSLAVADPSSGLALIISALAAALNLDRSQIDVIRADSAPSLAERVIVTDQSWLVPVVGTGTTNALITVARGSSEPPTRDEEDLLGLYAGYAAAAIERQDAETAQLDAAALRRSRELQRQFLSRLSHELRTPLTAIRGYASSLLAPDIVWDDESQQRFLETIAAESSRLGRLVDDLLDFSAIDSGVMRMQFDWCQLDLVIDAAVACLPEASRDTVSFTPIGMIPPMWADHDRLEQVFVNLLNNALQHNPAGTRVSISARNVAGGRLEIVVSDDGQGLPQELLEAPFDSPRRHRSSTARAGLGLSIARGIVTAHHGTIDLLPSEQGASFRIVLVLEGPEASPEPAHPATAVRSAARVGANA
ncbi:MAG TPA: ATP-binding cassette domain-containing protein [Solirubrobacteraceae bacterium]|jgi:signal transduction histidine kinase/ABC-type multidrug transport system ATPase subunit|nr:ATP-binding cassette domain-containing protein [Solirubrobacteraceae bacterium]